MSDVSWWPGLIVLAAGLAAGLFMTTRLRRTGKRVEKEQRARDLALKIRDLEERKDDLYRRLRDEGDSLAESDRQQLELSAARALRDLEAVTGEQSKLVLAVKKKDSREAAGGRQASEVQGSGRGRSLFTGFALGAAMVAVVGLLIYFAVRDTSGPAGQPSAGQEMAHPDAVMPSSEAQVEYESLTAVLESDPSDVMARKRLALLLVSTDQFVPAFEQARILRQNDPDDIDGLYVEAVVRIQMGQGESALQLLNRVIELFPQHVQAWGWLGIVYYQGGDLHSAIEAWERGVEAAGGQHPELEEMLGAARVEDAEAHAAASSSDSTVGGTPADWAMAGGEGAAAVESAAAPPEVAKGEDAFSVRLELAAGTGTPAGGVLFVALRPVGGGPPIAVRRMENPGFPLDIVLSSADSMMGSALPDSGLLTVRLDQDGDISAATEGDLSASAEITLGTAVTLELRP